MTNGTSTSLLRGAGRVGLTVASLALSTARADAQAPTGRATIRPFVGVFAPTGDQRDLLKDAVLLGAQLGWALRENLAVTGSFGWAPTADRTTAPVGMPTAPGGIHTGREEDVDLYQYDVAFEGRLPDLASSPRWSSRPYAALGVGGRTYDYRDLPGAGAETNVIGFGAVGLDVAPTTGRLGLRLEVRDNVSAFRGLRGERDERTARNDVQLTAGLTVRF